MMTHKQQELQMQLVETDARGQAEPLWREQLGTLKVLIQHQQYMVLM
jgi:hypothetical protein